MVRVELTEFDTTPYEESCAQVGSSDYSRKARIEAATLIDQLYRSFPLPEKIKDCAGLKLKYNAHDFGTYISIQAFYIPNKTSDVDKNEMALEWAYTIEDNFPAHWDEQALERLKKYGYFDPTD